MTDAEKLANCRELLEVWINKQSHDRCWYYPDIFNSLCLELGIKQEIKSDLPPEHEFKAGCERYILEQYY